MTPYVVSVVVYVAVLPLVLVGLDQAHRYWFITRAAEKARKNRSRDVPKVERLLPRLKRPLFFTMGDSRDLTVKSKTYDVQRRWVYWGLYGAGLLFALATPLMYSLGVVSCAFLLASLWFGVVSGNSLLKLRSRVEKRMAEIAVSALGQSRAALDNPSEFVRVLEWRELRYPQAMEFDVPTSFSSAGEAEFLRLVNQIFGQQTTFVAASETGDDGEVMPGWNYEIGKVKLRAVPPLPRVAPWAAHYIEDPGIAWSFFPLALGVENGVQMTNPETGEKEYVLGFDLSGLQAKASAKAGYPQGDEITTSPMVLVGGGTGGGKAQSLDTLIRVRRSHGGAVS